MTHTAVAALVIGIVACSGVPRDPGRDELLAFYAPTIELGQFAVSAGDGRYHFQPVAFFGYVDTSYQGGDGVIGIYLETSSTSWLESAPAPPFWARVSSVTLETRSRDVAVKVRARLQNRLGSPRESCYVGRERRRYLYWTSPTGFGVGLGLPAGEWDPSDTTRLAKLTFGDQEPDSAVGSSAKPVPCTVGDLLGAA
jgi:hypothetical protein